jgi:hypothetical protein
MVLLGVALMLLVVLFLSGAAKAEPSLDDRVPFRQEDPSAVIDEGAWDSYGWRSLGA